MLAATVSTPFFVFRFPWHATQRAVVPAGEADYALMFHVAFGAGGSHNLHGVVGRSVVARPALLIRHALADASAGMAAHAVFTHEGCAGVSAPAV